jgi:hypothetical protein
MSLTLLSNPNPEVQLPKHLTTAESITEGIAKLQLDEETGEMVSKNELKNRLPFGQLRHHDHRARYHFSGGSEGK